jgi:hypothetical protein
VGQKEFTHTDYAERATDLVRLVADAAAGRTRLHSTVTTRPPLVRGPDGELL